MRSVADSIDDQLIARILKLYGQEYKHISSPQTGYRNSIYPVRLANDSNICVILYKREPNIVEKIENANRLGSYLHKQGLPSRYPLNEKLVRVSSANGERYAGLYNYLPGETIPWEAYSQAHLKLLGATMGRMHLSLKQVSRQSLPLITDEYIVILDRMLVYFNSAGVRSALKNKLEVNISVNRFKDHKFLLNSCSKLQGQQPLHMDFVRSNILFDEREGLAVSGILDLEKAAYGHPIFDVARTLSFLLVDCKYKPVGKVRKYFLDSGYIKRGQNKLADIKIKYAKESVSLLDCLVDLFLIYDFYKFLLHNPYEFLNQNEHFIRTRDLLIERNLVDKITSKAAMITPVSAQ